MGTVRETGIPPGPEAGGGIVQQEISAIKGRRFVGTRLQAAHIETDVLVLGGGMTGYRAAVSARASGASVVMAYRARGASPYVIGFNVPLGDADPRDNAQIYYDDVVRGGYELSDRRLVRVLANRSIEAYEELVRLGVPFACADEGLTVSSLTGGSSVRRRALQRHLSGNSYPRSVYIPEGTGNGIIGILNSHAREMGVEIVPGHKVVDLLRDGDEVVGALLYKPHSHDLIAVRARSVVLAMGGIGRLYADSTYPVDVSGDALGLAFEAGACLIDMEFVQFEPVVTVWPAGCRGMEMPTAMLGDGAHLLNRLGERFMLAYNPPHAERLIEKARLALCIQREIDEGRGFPAGGVEFDTTLLAAEQLESYVSHCKRLRAAGLDPVTARPLVAPAAHSLMGGVAVDEQCWSGVPGLYVAGEAAGGVHGASRIAGNGGSDTLVFGGVAGEGAAAGMTAMRPRDWAEIEQQALARLASRIERAAPGAGSLDDVREAIRCALSSAAGIWRNGESLADGKRKLQALAASLAHASADTLPDAIELIGVQRMALVGQMIVEASLVRTESRGAHQRTDFPESDDRNWLRHVSFRAGNDSAPLQEYTPVQ
ncbi:L-aspartate oxidase [Burkholderia sp. WAC0059]|uniref:FAD-binding protein n=1 Tax=Burkholderia sp. WAC0059 TaxID=2066022 RepID=UPI000C7F4D15|nr:FAD-binding protein [Burkholderia sp. WAC0059]PLZ02672.1 L-aspartate oxidase [Burkholderia sp. WAC0059]